LRSEFSWRRGLFSFASWLSGRKPALAGFLIALPLSSLISLAFSYWEYRDMDKLNTYARPSWWRCRCLSFSSFRFCSTSGSKWALAATMLSAIGLLAIAYFVHTALLNRSRKHARLRNDGRSYRHSPLAGQEMGKPSRTRVLKRRVQPGAMLHVYWKEDTLGRGPALLFISAARRPFVLIVLVRMGTIMSTCRSRKTRAGRAYRFRNYFDSGADRPFVRRTIAGARAFFLQHSGAHPGVSIGHGGVLARAAVWMKERMLEYAGRSPAAESAEAAKE